MGVVPVESNGAECRHRRGVAQSQPHRSRAEIVDAKRAGAVLEARAVVDEELRAVRGELATVVPLRPARRHDAYRRPVGAAAESEGVVLPPAGLEVVREGWGPAESVA